MPYITQVQRNVVDDKVQSLINSMKSIDGFEDNKAGVLNYITTCLCAGAIGSSPRYSKINEMIGMLECCKLELYRRVAGPYEDIKTSQNGDVYPIELLSR